MRTLTGVLVVDDEPDIRVSLAAWLVHRLAWEARTASGPLEALEMVRDWRPDVVVSDYRMPHMDGILFLEELRRRLPGTRTLLLTADVDERVSRRAAGTGAVDCVLTKTAGAEDIAAAARRLHEDGTCACP